MDTYSTSEFKAGLKVILDKQPYSIVENEFIKPGKGQAFNRVKLRNLKTGKMLDKTFKSGETVTAADVLELELQYLYESDGVWHFMDPRTYNQYEVNRQVVQDAALWLKEQDVCIATIWNDAVISITPPNFVELKVTETEPGLKGDTSSGGGTKPATLETGVVVRVPLFVRTDEIVKIDTRDASYVSRVK